LKNVEEIDKFVATHDHANLNQEDINHVNRSITNNEIETATKCFLKKKITVPDRFTAEFYQTFEEPTPLSLKLLKNTNGRNNIKLIL
jgi:putative IMPACT (imprinted ancient) family translation regulator